MIKVPSENGRLIEYHSQSYHHVSDDKVEDAFAVLSSLAQALNDVKKRYPNMKHAYLFSDGAGCYGGAYLAVNLSQLGAWTGVKLLAHFKSVSGRGKSILDSIFGLQGQFLDRVSSYGPQHDIRVASDLEQQLNFEGGIKGTVNSEMVFDREKQDSTKKAALPGIQMMHERRYNYKNHGTFKSLTVFENSFSNNKGKTYSAKDLKEMMKNGKFQEKPATLSVTKDPQQEQKAPVKWDNMLNNKNSKIAKRKINQKKKANKKKEIYQSKIDYLQQTRRKSNQKCCPNCYRDFQYQSNLNRHLAENNCHPTKTALRKNHGTEKAELMYPDEQFMKKNEDGQASFEWKEFVSRYEMKSYFGRLQQEKKKEAAAAQAKNRKK